MTNIDDSPNLDEEDYNHRRRYVHSHTKRCGCIICCRDMKKRNKEWKITANKIRKHRYNTFNYREVSHIINNYKPKRDGYKFRKTERWMVKELLLGKVNNAIEHDKNILILTPREVLIFDTVAIIARGEKIYDSEYGQFGKIRILVEPISKRDMAKIVVDLL